MARTIIGGANRNVRFTIFTERADRFFRGAGGEIDRATKQAADELLKRSRAKIGKTYSGDHGGTKLKDTGRVVRASTKGDWAVTFRHRAAEVHYKGTTSYIMPRKTTGAYYRRRKVEFGPTKGPIRRRALPGNPYIKNAAREMGLVVAENVTLERGAGGFNAPGLIRIPKNF